MIALFIALCTIVTNMIIGAAVWSLIDDKEHHLYKWYNECPSQIAWVAQPLVLTAWPIGLYLWFKTL